MQNILILSFYYPPDLCAGSFRTAALVEALLEQLPSGARIEVITTLPNRYHSYSTEAPLLEEHPQLTVRRIPLPPHQSGMRDQAKAFAVYARGVVAQLSGKQYSLVFGTSSRLMTAVLSRYAARRLGAPLYLDIRDIFVDTMQDLLPKPLSLVTHPLLQWLERWAIGGARHVNLVSKGFEGYFRRRFPRLPLSFFSNGIDLAFIEAAATVVDAPALRSPASSVLTVVYAGNIGEGQGLHKILPPLALRLGDRVRFKVIGDGGRKNQLKQALDERGCTNVELCDPVDRDRLIIEYHAADLLFLHLNDHKAFLKVLPSKLFEYAAMGKPVLAGVSGYAASFVEAELSNAAVFEPCDVDGAARALDRLQITATDRSEFVEKYARPIMMQAMAAEILALGGAPSGKGSGSTGKGE